MAYKTTEVIRDLQDNEYRYRKGETFPREGLDVSQERLDELVKGGHIIQDEDINLNSLKKDELIEYAHSKGLDVTDKATKAEILELLGE